MNLTKLGTILPALSTVVAGVKTRRGGRAIKAYRPEHSPAELSQDVRDALLALVRQDITVRVYTLGSIYTLGLTVDGQLSWDNCKATNSAYRNNVIVKVVL